jgi:hypothetical protein
MDEDDGAALVQGVEQGVLAAGADVTAARVGEQHDAVRA